MADPDNTAHRQYVVTIQQEMLVRTRGDVEVAKCLAAQYPPYAFFFEADGEGGYWTLKSTSRVQVVNAREE